MRSGAFRPRPSGCSTTSTSSKSRSAPRERHLPRGYSRELPRLARSPDAAGAGMPRVYDLALELVAHGDGRIGRGTLMRFVAAYQSVQPLRLGELWAIPIMLRLALIENLRRVASRVAVGCTDRDTAGTWADSMLEVAENDAERPDPASSPTWRARRRR